MGQAQSMSSGDTGCEDCIKYSGYPGIERVPGKLGISHPGDDRLVQTSGADTSTPGIARPGAGVVSGGAIYPSDIISNGQITFPGGVDRGGSIYPDIIIKASVKALYGSWLPPKCPSCEFCAFRHSVNTYVRRIAL